MSIGRRVDVESLVPSSVIRMERGRWQGDPGLYIEGVQTESRWLRSVRTGSSCLTSLRAWPRPSWLSRRRSRQSHGQSRRRVFTGRFCSFLPTWHVRASHVLLETTRLAVVACTGFVLLVTARSGANSTQHGKTRQVQTQRELTDCSLFLDSTDGVAWPFSQLVQ